MDGVTLTIPARPDFVHVIRSVVASVAARADFSFDAIDDLRLAVDEACAQLLSFRPGATVLEIEIAWDQDGLEVVAAIDGDATGWPPPGSEDTLTWQVLAALADEATFDRTHAGPAVRLRKRREVAGAV